MTRQRKNQRHHTQPTINPARTTPTQYILCTSISHTVYNTVWLYSFVFSLTTRILLTVLVGSLLVPPLPLLASESDDETSIVSLETAIQEDFDTTNQEELEVLPDRSDIVSISDPSFADVVTDLAALKDLSSDDREGESDTDDNSEAYTMEESPPPDTSLAPNNVTMSTSSIESGSSSSEQITQSLTDIDQFSTEEIPSATNTEMDDVSDSVDADTVTGSERSDANDESDPGTQTNDSTAQLEENQQSLDADEVVDTPSTEPPPVAGPLQTLTSEVSSDAQVTFSRDQCVVIENGSFYCQTAVADSALPDGLFAAPDTGGDLEIFFTRSGERVQLTNNNVDDASPFYDQYSNSIVWHRLIDDRYQIVSFDVETGDEFVLTNTTVNNMEPSRHGRYTVWQRWVQNNWEIILHDGAREQQLTQSIEHDIAPRIRGSLVIWNTRSQDGEQQLQTYDIAQRTFTRIAEGAGVSVANPRMIVMFDEVHQNGDIVTKGFDLLTGEIVPLSALPRELPDRIPGSDGTGETRALIQSTVTTPKSDDDSDGDGDVPVTTDSDIDDVTLDLRDGTSGPLVQERSVIPYDIPDLDLTQSTTSPEVVYPDIPDLIIPPAVASSTQ